MVQKRQKVKVNPFTFLGASLQKLKFGLEFRTRWWKRLFKRLKKASLGH